VPHEAFYATAAGVIPIFLILLVFQTRGYQGLAASRLRRPGWLSVYVVFVGLKVSAARRDSSSLAPLRGHSGTPAQAMARSRTSGGSL
jgi:hypothetical protein